jgi:hypothetical protein
MTKKLQKLLAKHRKANRARLTAYARRSRVLGGVCIQVEEFGKTSWKRVFRVPITDELKKELDANIEKARLAKLEVSKEIQEYCKKKKYHISWNSDNHIIAVRNHTGWMLRKHPISLSAQFLLKTMYRLKLTTKQEFYPF